LRRLYAYKPTFWIGGWSLVLLGLMDRLVALRRHVLRAPLEGNCWDNAPTESWFNSFKNERVHGVGFATREGMKATAFEGIEVFYNRKRLHSTLGYKSPTQFMHDWLTAQPMEKQVA